MPFTKPALRISNVVYGREREGQRVTYLVNEAGLGTDRGIAEDVVLRRWRSRKLDGFQFSGGRLPPSMWRALPIVLGNDIEQWPTYAEEVIDEKKKAALPLLHTALVDVPAPSTIVALIAACGTERLRKLVERHKDEKTRDSTGVPDLFLFATEHKTGASFHRFVEVKKPDEQMRPCQVEELVFLISMGLPARMLKLIERPRTSPRDFRGQARTIT